MHKDALGKGLMDRRVNRALIKYICVSGAQKHISSTGIFTAIAKNTLYGSKLYIFLLCQKSLGY